MKQNNPVSFVEALYTLMAEHLNVSPDADFLLYIKTPNQEPRVLSTCPPLPIAEDIRQCFLHCPPQPRHQWPQPPPAATKEDFPQFIDQENPNAER